MEPIKTEGDVNTLNNEGEVSAESSEQADVISISKSEYDKLNQTLGSLKRELKDFKKAKEEPKETPQTNSKPEDNSLLQKAFLRSAQITDSEEVELALSTAKKWGVSVDQLVDDDDFKAKLDKHRINKANIAATSNVRGGAGTSQAKLTPEYWVAKGVPPTAADVPDRRLRGKIARALMDSAKNSKKFYND